MKNIVAFSLFLVPFGAVYADGEHSPLHPPAVVQSPLPGTAPGMGHDPAHHHGEGGMGGKHLCRPTDRPQPLLSAADFDASGYVDEEDFKLLKEKLKDSSYEAIMDRDADSDLDHHDLMLAEREYGKASTPLDRELVTLYQATVRYRDVKQAIADGFRPLTQTLKGHGIHYGRLPIRFTPEGKLDPNYQNVIDKKIDQREPEGLNYDENGNLIAIFHLQSIDAKNWILTQDKKPLIEEAMSFAASLPKLYSSPEEAWHQHFGACWIGLNYLKMSLDPTIVPYFINHLTMQECAQRSSQGEPTLPEALPNFGWLPSFNMLHVWLYKLNPCGAFAGTHPAVATQFSDEPFGASYDEWHEKQFGH
jgi:hypothetical protein